MAKKPASTSATPAPRPQATPGADAGSPRSDLHNPLDLAVLRAARDELERAVAQRTWQAVESWFPGSPQKAIAGRLRLTESKVSRWKTAGTWSTESLLQVLFKGPVEKRVGRDWTNLRFANDANEVVLTFPALDEFKQAIEGAYRQALFAARRVLHPSSPKAELTAKQILALLLMFRHNPDGPLDYAWAFPPRQGASWEADLLATLGTDEEHKRMLGEWNDVALRTFRVLRRYFNLPPA